VHTRRRRLRSAAFEESITPFGGGYFSPFPVPLAAPASSRTVSSRIRGRAHDRALHQPPTQSPTQSLTQPLARTARVHRRRVPLTIVSLTITGVLVVVACGSDVQRAASTTTAASAAAVTTSAPEKIHVDAAAVTAGFSALPATIAAAIAAIGTPDAKARLAAIEAQWFSFEGTVRDTDTTIYLAIEDQLTPLQRQIERGDAATATTTAATLVGLFAQYMATYR
jgi:hypothetical protein